MKSKILLSLVAITLPSISYANEESEIISPITCQNETKCYFDIYDNNYTFLKRVNIDFEENESTTKLALTYNFFDNRDVSESLYTICMKSNDKCKIFSNEETAKLIFNNGYFPIREKRNAVLLSQIAREIGRQTSKAFNTPAGKKVAEYIGAKYAATMAAIDVLDGNDPWTGNPLPRNTEGRGDRYGSLGGGPSGRMSDKPSRSPGSSAERMSRTAR